MKTRFQALLTWLVGIHWMDLVGILTLIAVAGLIFIGYAPTAPQRWFSLALMIIFGVLATLHPQVNGPDRREFFRFAGLTLLTIFLIYLKANLNGVVVLYFLMSAQVLAILPRPIGYRWIAVWGLLTIVTLTLEAHNLFFGTLNGLGAFCGYLFIGSAANAQQRAESASRESQGLLRELQAAHRQLQDYAVRAEELAVAQERNRLAREMHDTLGHRLTVAAVQLEGAQRLIPNDPAKAVRMVGTVREQVLEGLTDLRRTVATLRTPLEADLSLLHALTRLVANFQQATGLQVYLTLPDALPALPAEHRHALYRAAQELLTNVQRHAQAQQVWLRLTLQKQAGALTAAPTLQIHLSVEDDGQGFSSPDAQTPTHGGYGLRGLRERAEQLQGEFHIAPSQYGGASLALSLPWPLLETAKVETPPSSVL